MKRISLILLLPLLLLGSCEQETPTPTPREVLATLEVKAPIGQEGVVTKVTGHLTEQRSGTQVPLTFDTNKAEAKVRVGESYSLQLVATYEANNLIADIEYAEEFKVVQKLAFTKVCQLTFQAPKGGFVISEIFFAGTRNRLGEQYDEDKYIKITNNSPVTRYADGLALAESLWDSSEKKEGIEPNVMETHFATDLVMQLPGSGKEYPVAPYQSIILCHSAIDHTKVNPNSIDLSGANFEWMDDKGYSDSSTPDNPAIPNMKLVFLSDPYTEGTHNWAMNNNGQKSYALVDLQGKTAKEIAKECNYEYEEVQIIEGMEPMKLPGVPALKLPLEWVVDAVNLAMKNELQWLPISPKLDAGYASVADDFNSTSRYGKVVVRKPISAGAKQLQDTNNSSADFESKEIK